MIYFLNTWIYCCCCCFNQFLTVCFIWHMVKETGRKIPRKVSRKEIARNREKNLMIQFRSMPDLETFTPSTVRKGTVNMIRNMCTDDLDNYDLRLPCIWNVAGLWRVAEWAIWGEILTFLDRSVVRFFLICQIVSPRHNYRLNQGLNAQAYGV